MLGYTDEKVVSTDFSGEPCASVFDATAGITLDKSFVKIVAWYDNEWGYAKQCLEMVRVVAKRSEFLLSRSQVPAADSDADAPPGLRGASLCHIAQAEYRHLGHGCLAQSAFGRFAHGETQCKNIQPIHEWLS